MAKIIDYDVVLSTATADGLRCLYHNSGAFGFVSQADAVSFGWIASPDATIRPAALSLVRTVAGPVESTLSLKFTRAWTEHLPGEMWLMPKSHWAYELQYGNRDWLPLALEDVGIDSKSLDGRNNAAAVAMSTGEAVAAGGLIGWLLNHLTGSDFAVLFPGHRTICTVHHHRQLWWTTTDAGVAAGLELVVERS